MGKSPFGGLCVFYRLSQFLNKRRWCETTISAENHQKTPKKGESIMKKLLFIVVSVLLLTLGLGFSANTAIAEGEDTSIQNVLLDNDKVKVVENVRHPGYLAKMHSHKTYIAYFFGPCKLKFTFPDGKTSVKDIPAGKLVWSDGTTHEVEVLGNTDLHTLHIEFKE